MIKIAVDAMGGDGSPKKVIDGIIHHFNKNKNSYYKIFGDKGKILNHINSDLPKSFYEIIHTTDYIEMLKQAYQTEKTASEVYGEILETLKNHNDDELYDSIENIYFAELRSVEEVRMLLE